MLYKIGYVIFLLDCVKYRNFTQLPAVKILWKRSFRKISALGNKVKLRYSMQWYLLLIKSDKEKKIFFLNSIFFTKFL